METRSSRASHRHASSSRVSQVTPLTSLKQKSIVPLTSSTSLPSDNIRIVSTSLQLSSASSASPTASPTAAITDHSLATGKVFGLNTPIFIAVVAGGGAILLILILAAWCCFRKRKREKARALDALDNSSLSDLQNMLQQDEKSKTKTHIVDVLSPHPRFLPRSISRSAKQDPKTSKVTPFDVDDAEARSTPQTPTSGVPLLMYQGGTGQSTPVSAAPSRPQRSPEAAVPLQHSVNELALSTSTIVTGPPAYINSSSRYDDTMDATMRDDVQLAETDSQGYILPESIGVAQTVNQPPRSFHESRQPIANTNSWAAAQAARRSSRPMAPIVFSSPPRKRQGAQTAHGDETYARPVLPHSDSMANSDSTGSLVLPLARSVGQAPMLFRQVTDTRYSIRSEMAEVGGGSERTSPIRPIFVTPSSASPSKPSFSTSLDVSPNNALASAMSVPRLLVADPEARAWDVRDERQRQISNGTVASLAHAPTKIGQSFITAVDTPPVTPKLPEQADAPPGINVLASSFADESWESNFVPLDQMNLLASQPDYRSPTYSIYNAYADLDFGNLDK